MSPSFSLADIESASSLLTPHVKRTPLVKSDVLSRRLGTNIYLKAELFQKTGAFKVRGAFNKMLRLMPEERGQGVVAVRAAITRRPLPTWGGSSGSRR